MEAYFVKSMLMMCDVFAKVSCLACYNTLETVVLLIPACISKLLSTWPQSYQITNYCSIFIFLKQKLDVCFIGIFLFNILIFIFFFSIIIAILCSNPMRFTASSIFVQNICMNFP